MNKFSDKEQWRFNKKVQEWNFISNETAFTFLVRIAFNRRQKKEQGVRHFYEYATSHKVLTLRTELYTECPT